MYIVCDAIKKIELTSLWKIKCTVIPAGSITSMLEAYLQRLMVHKFCTVELLQRTAVLGSTVVISIIDTCNLQLTDLVDLSFFVLYQICFAPTCCCVRIVSNN